MGLGIGISRSSYPESRECERVMLELKKTLDAGLPNPNPKNFEIIYGEQIGEYLIVKIKYPDCTNYEGIKILVYDRGTTFNDLIQQGSIDPHFSENKDFHSPIARFVPTAGGMIMAKAFVNAMIKGKF